MSKKIFLLSFLLFYSALFAQTKKERVNIVNQTNYKYLQKLSRSLSVANAKQKTEAEQKAKEMGWPIKGSQNGQAFELIRLTPDGKPVYYQTENYYAAKTINTDKLYNNGGLGLNIQGQNMIVGIWDGGAVRGTHNFLTGRVTQRDGAVFTGPDDLNRHATHVTGTMIANGITRYRGMAFNASCWAHDWFNDDAEMAARAAEGLLVSNHSYGMRAFNYLGQRLIDIYWFGKYSDEARNWDDIMFNAPYYIAVDAAGNDRYYASNGSNKGGYDMLTGNSTNKNGITVAAVRRVSVYNGPSSVTMSGFSNWGPTDDGRIKPDISGQGVSVSSCISDSDTATDTYDGTSMASPTITGSLILLQQLYHETYGNYIRSSTLKGLALHTAREAGSHTGPDYAFGWGLMNTAAAAEAIVNNGLTSNIKEITLHQGETYSFTVNSDGTNPLMASICWTDPAGHVIKGTVADMLDNPTPALVNDLDIRVTKNGTTYYPWKLNPAHPSAAATTGDNTVDNFEKIQVNNASGTYTITVSHKGNLKYNKQVVSIIVTGISNPFAINATDGENRDICSDNTTSTTYNLRYTKSNAVSGTTNFSLNNLPAGATATFSPTGLSADGNFSLQISGLDNVAAGIYNLEVVGTNGSQQIIKELKLHVLKDNFTPQNLIAPADGAVDLRKPFSLDWEAHPNAQQYQLQIAVNANFNNIILDEIVNNPSYLIKEHTYGISDGGTYYWRVKPLNDCASGNFSEVRSFSTLQINCNQSFNTTAVSIPTTASSSPYESQINYGQSSTISSVKVYVDITHTNISDLEIKLVSPQGTEVILNQSGTCSGNYQNIQVVYDDNSENFLDCNPTPPAIRDDMKPFETMSAFNGENAQGDWTLKVYDPVSGNGGSLNMWALEICEEILGINDQDFELFKVWPNPSSGQVNIQLSAGKRINVRLLDMSGRAVFHRVYNNSGDTFTKNVILGHLKKGIYLLQVNSENKSGVKRIIIK